MILVEQSVCYAFIAGAVYIASVQNQQLQSLARILACGSACALLAWQRLA